jgi:hypothetical protein
MCSCKVQNRPSSKSLRTSTRYTSKPSSKFQFSGQSPRGTEDEDGTTAIGDRAPQHLVVDDVASFCCANEPSEDRAPHRSTSFASSTMGSWIHGRRGDSANGGRCDHCWCDLTRSASRQLHLSLCPVCRGVCHWTQGEAGQ